jgi:protein-tyrosine phosphatase
MTTLVSRSGLADRIGVDSAGTGAWHVGESADRRSRAAAQARGYDLTSLARRFVAEDFARFDYVLAMDRSNRRDLLALTRSPTEQAKVHLFRDFDPQARGEADVPDPYYGGANGFDDVFDMCERTCRALLQHLCKELELTPRGN